MADDEMTEEDARRIQSHADRTDSNQGFKRRAQRAADRNARESGGGSGEEGGDS
jgi:hypothetical protein